MADGGTPAAQRVLGVFAHPDDETFCAGGTLAKYASAGARTTVVSATRGQAGQIRDAAVATRATLGAVRERELERACVELGVHECRVLDHVDGTLADLGPGVLRDEVLALLRELRPDVVITFGSDGAYGHPDHVAIGAAVTEACRTLGGVRLYHSHFRRSRLLMLDRLADWLVHLSDRFAGSIDFVRALSIFAQETTTLGYASDSIDVQWFPAGSYIIEQGEAATSLYLIISGTAEIVATDGNQDRQLLARVGPGEFVGEIGVAYGQPRMADVIAVESVTCLVFSISDALAFEGRGAGASLTRAAGAESSERFPIGATTRIDVSGHVDRKIAAIAAHRSQYPIEVDMFPRDMLRDMFSAEYFTRVLPAPELEAEL